MILGLRIGEYSYIFWFRQVSIAIFIAVISAAEMGMSSSIDCAMLVFV
jgi:hypothetical protein